jgi:hypothetical protein
MAMAMAMAMASGPRSQLLFRIEDLLEAAPLPPLQIERLLQAAPLLLPM